MRLLREDLNAGFARLEQALRGRPTSAANDSGDGDGDDDAFMSGALP